MPVETKIETVEMRRGHMNKPGYFMLPIREDIIADLVGNGKTDFGVAVDVKLDDVLGGAATHILIKAQGE
jgi:hypothetical protein